MGSRRLPIPNPRRRHHFPRINHGTFLARRTKTTLGRLMSPGARSGLVRNRDSRRPGGRKGNGGQKLSRCPECRERASSIAQKIRRRRVCRGEKRATRQFRVRNGSRAKGIRRRPLAGARPLRFGAGRRRTEVDRKPLGSDGDVGGRPLRLEPAGRGNRGRPGVALAGVAGDPSASRRFAPPARPMGRIPRSAGRCPLAGKPSRAAVQPRPRIGPRSIATSPASSSRGSCRSPGRW